MGYDVIIPISVKDVGILLKNIKYIKNNLDYKKIVIVGNDEVLLKTKHILSNEIEFKNENDIFDGLSYSTVADILYQRCGKKRRTGWYLQQFIKLAYSYICDDKYYLVWDADTIPLKRITFTENDKVLFNLKDEYNKPYFRTMNKLFNVKKSKIVKQSFISEHMLFDKTIVIKMLDEICSNDNLFGKNFYEKILYSIRKKDLNKSGFSEFETYGTYNYKNNVDHVKFRSLNTLRHGKVFLGENPSDELLLWAAKDFDTISFEKYDKPLKSIDRYTSLEFISNNSLKDLYDKKKKFIKYKDMIIQFLRKIFR